MILAPDDIQVDSHVAIHSTRRPRLMRTKVNSLRNAVLETEFVDEPPVPQGVPLRVLATSLPFILCSVMEPSGTEAGPVIIDVRTVNLTRMSAAFVQALVEFGEASGSNSDPDVTELLCDRSNSDTCSEPPMS